MTAFQTHLQSGVTTVCRIWAVTRRDGMWFGFTDHDQDITFDGRLFRANSGMTSKALQQTTGLAVDNTEAMGALSDAAIEDQDILAGRFDGAQVESWLLNWADPRQNTKVFRGNFGDITRAGGAFKVELRGLTDQLNQPQGRVYQRGCSAVLGDESCGFNLNTAGFRIPMVLTGKEQGLILSGPAPQPNDWFTLGRVTVITGAGAGLIGMVKRDRATQGGRIIELWQDFALPLSIGDEITLEAGCDRQATTCAAKFNNMLNFQGFPFIPGEDWQISYPNSIQIKDGGSLFK